MLVGMIVAAFYIDCRRMVLRSVDFKRVDIPKERRYLEGEIDTGASENFRRWGFPFFHSCPNGSCRRQYDYQRIPARHRYSKCYGRYWFAHCCAYATSVLISFIVLGITRRQKP